MEKDCTSVDKVNMGNRVRSCRSGYTLVEMSVVLVLVGIASLGVFGVMTTVNKSMESFNGEMTMGMYTMEAKHFIDNVNPADGVGFCMKHGGPQAASYSQKSLGEMLSAKGPSTLSQIISNAQASPGSKQFRVELPATIVFNNSNIYGGTTSQKSSGFLTLMSSELHSFVVRKNIEAFLVNAAMAKKLNVVGPSINGNKDKYMFLVSAIWEQKFQQERFL
jgi:prepilin-type N-terminal cleavage/methylation domain-containing protein